jgi:O-antigen ligase
LIPKINNNLNVAWLGIFFFFLAIVAPWFNLTISSHDIVKAYFASFGVASLMLLSLYYKLNISEINLKINYIKLSLFLLFIFGSLSALWSINFDFTVGKWLLWLIATFSFVLALNLSTSHENLVKLAWGLTIAAGTIAFIGLLQYYFNPFSLTQAAWPASTFGNKNVAIQPLVLILPLSIFLLLSSQVQGLKVWVLSGITSLVIVYIIFSESRSAWLSIFIELFVIILYFLTFKTKIFQWIDWSKNKRNASIFAILFTIILINITPSSAWESLSFTNTLPSVIERITSTGSSSDGASFQRFQIWQTAINMIYDAPFIGTGLGSYSQNLANEGYATWTINNTIRAHNDLLELAVELGLIGVIFFITAVISLCMGIFNILKQTTGETHLFFCFLFVALIGSFVNMQFSFPYQMAFPLSLFGLYSGLIAKHVDLNVQPIKNLKFKIKLVHKKIIFVVSSVLIIIIFYYTYFNWIKLYEQLDEINILGEFNKIEVVETPIYHSGIPYILNHLGGRYFKKGHFKQSYAIDKQLLKLWPNHLDVLFRVAYAEHKLNRNNQALELAKRLKRLEPQGLYNGYTVEMFVYSSTNDLNKLEQTFKELISQPEQFLKLNDDTYRFLIFFTLASNNLSKHAPLLYEKFIDSHGYSCEVENNLAIHYFNLENFISSVKHIKRTIGKEQKCVNPELIRLLSEKNLIDQKKYL